MPWHMIYRAWMARWSFPTMSASFVPTVMVNVSSHVGCTVTAGRSAAKSEDVSTRRSSVGFMRELRLIVVRSIHTARDGLTAESGPFVFSQILEPLIRR